MTPRRLKVTPEPIARFLRRKRDELQMTQEEFAFHIGVVVATVSRWERGDHEPSPQTFERVRERLGA